MSTALIVLVSVEFAGLPPAQATAWAVRLQSLNAASAQAQPAPLPPSPVTASCALIANAITVSWPAAAHATGYSVYQSNSSGGTYVLVGTVTASPWTSGALLLGTFFYKVSATIGPTWVSAQSAASNSKTIAAIACL